MKTVIINKKASTGNFLSKILFGIMLICLAQGAKSQNYDAFADNYRITAYQNTNNAIFSVSNEVKITPAAVLYIPNAFTPNGDGLNETFGPVGEGIVEYNMQIFDRWGILIFESNDLKKQWDGYVKDAKAPTGTYVYKITGKGQGEVSETTKLINKNGTVTLVL